MQKVLTGKHVSDILSDSVRKLKLQIVKGKVLLQDQNLVNTEIANSWKRTNDSGLAVNDKEHFKQLPDTEYKILLQEKLFLYRAYIQYPKQIENLILDSQNGFFFTDEKGILLGDVVAKDPTIFDKFKAGTIINEQTVGTCSHVLSLIHCQPMQTVGAENYLDEFFPYSLSSAPIQDLNGKLAGVFTIFGKTENHPSTYLLGLTIAFAGALRNEYRRYNDTTLLSNVTDKDDRALFLFNLNWLLIHANKKAREMLPLSVNIGQPFHFRDLFGSLPDVLNDLEQEKTVYNITFSIKSTMKKAFIQEARPFFDGDGNILGYLFVLHPKIKNKWNESVKAQRLGKEITFDSIIGRSDAITKTKEAAKKMAAYDVRVFIRGESGTGKELFAHSIHNEWRPGNPFIAVNCAAIAKNLIESELFGYEGGAFTGADSKGRLGKIELARGGTLFLDEIGDMPMDAQPTLLRVLEDKKLMRVGGNEYIAVDFRLITATNKDLQKLIEDGCFREDLYYRLATFQLELPPLRSRKSDIVDLTNYFLEKTVVHFGLSERSISNESLEKLLAYDWPGNIRQLENVITYAAVMTDKEVICPEHLPLLGESGQKKLK